MIYNSCAHLLHVNAVSLFLPILDLSGSGHYEWKAHLLLIDSIHINSDCKQPRANFTLSKKIKSDL